ncbi:hypothetical protein GCM10007978_41460 [Shewanella hanedai]|uniref:Uncharacterized protein n=1 Tax=Shewanella hanedai TaxID=25 RepID=A0A553JIM9_SHEHA|nr:hypothetical protein [Shewanella hanedai]TRY12312.1 hypothetical protein FN961_21495 [Shewanella hanedai]GGI99377.1 hypothetical protein GCM10007978_41460 [Shewanella hanedai]
MSNQLELLEKIVTNTASSSNLIWIAAITGGTAICTAAVTASIGYFNSKTSMSFEAKQYERVQYYKLMDEKKVKHSEFLSQSQEMIQSTLNLFYLPDSDEYKRYLRAFNDAQIISDEHFSLASYQVFDEVQKFALLNKEGLSCDFLLGLVNAAREKVSILRAIAKTDVTKPYTGS